MKKRSRIRLIQSIPAIGGILGIQMNITGDD